MNKLLITLGDSWTFGVGSYDPWIKKLYGDPPHIPKGSPQEHFDITFNLFLEKSWTKLLANKMGYDINNLASGGMSNPGIAKDFYHRKVNTSKYDEVMVIWMITDPSRMGFFSNQKIKNITPSMDNIYEVCFNKMLLVDEDFFMETSFYLKAVDYFCKIKNFQFYYASAFSDVTPIVKLYRKDNLLHGNFKSYKEILTNDDMSKCGHPNETGYEKIANELYNQMKLRGIV